MTDCFKPSGYKKLGTIPFKIHYTLYEISFIKDEIMIGTILLILLVLILIGGLPRWGYSRNWGYGPSGVVGLILVIFLILVLLGRIPLGF